MNRREFAKVFSAIAAGFTVNGLLISGRDRLIDLNWFCGEYATRRFNITKPFHQSNFWFATDARICLRVGSCFNDTVDAPDKLPNAAGLAWNQLNSCEFWKPWPKVERFLNPNDAGDKNTSCFYCGGYGVIAPPNQVPECPDCETEGRIYVDEYGSGSKCLRCDGVGFIAGNLPKCDRCNGRGYIEGLVPNVQTVGRSVISSWHDNLVRRLDCVEFLDVERDRLDPVGFRFNGGFGLLMPVDIKQ